MAVADMFKPWRWFGRYGWKLLLVLMAIVAAYLVYLDSQIQHRFNGTKWQVPAQIFARPMTLALGQDVTRGEIVDELELLGYRRVSHAKNTGEYEVATQRIAVRVRPFTFPDGYQSASGVLLTLQDGKLVEIRDLDGNQTRETFRLEPWLVTRLVTTEREDRMLVSFDDVPKALINALLVVEDQNFYQHHGVAPLAILRALFANIAAGRAVQGGSTLTQQLVKNMYLSNEKSIVRKVKEALMSVLIDARYSKDEILEAYLNEVFLGQNGAMAVHGFGLASYYYFDRPLNELNLPEIATLVGMIKGPSYYNPKRYPERVTERRNLVLKLMFDNNLISRTEYEPLLNAPLVVTDSARFREGKHPAFMDKVRRELQQVLANPDIRQAGIKVFTTLDSIAQRKAEAALQSSLTTLDARSKAPRLQGAMVVSDIRSGEIRALIGDRQVDYDGFNRALDARRSVGSLIKPAIYLTALEDPGNYNLATPLADEPIALKSSYGKRWEPQNADRKFRGRVPLVEALTRSLNVPTVSLGMTLGLPVVADAIARLGVDADVPLYPALTLGAVDLSPLSVNQMYQTIANEGRYVPLHAVSAVLSPQDDLLWRFDTPAEQRFDEKASYLLNYALHKVTREGTAKALDGRFPEINMAGKTGTTDDYRDSWFSGYDKYTLTTAWVGDDDNQPTGLTGASGALQVFIDYQSRIVPKSLTRRFPAGLGIAHFNHEDGRYMRAGCKNSLSVPAILAALPEEPMDCAGQERQPKQEKSWWERLLGRD
ncbi:penicillin-binding protein 1B [Aestuariibacter halophilus]|uniref:Penicillin-binding protein 1B n=1 Tax=Fluctibacter halophilus TaxID=226011 RepID=A0ABS8GA09_9ALTE|nr:penicillin-binding protein 1B [Aestuariibacter halophilus]MCC2617414.1 penicillin-binding protein 1B [Aestuariibacter halophilus]